MRKMAVVLLTGALGLLAPCLAAWAAELEGVKMPDTMKLANRDLVLNGIGLRSRFGFKVYVAGLYLLSKSNDAGMLLQQLGPKRVAMVMKRDVEAQTFLNALRDGLTANHTEAQLAALKDRLQRFDETIAAIKEAKQGDRIDLDYVPDSGTQIIHNGKAIGTLISGEDFYRALLRIWLGDNPVQESLKQGWLGKN